MERLEELLKHRPVKVSRRRFNVAGPDAPVKEYTDKKRGQVFQVLVKGVRSEVVRDGPVFDAVREQLPWANRVTLNKNLVCKPHRDKTNKGTSCIAFFDGSFFRMARRPFASA